MSRKKQKKPTGNVIAVNRRARHDYFIEDTIEAGLVLVPEDRKTVGLVPTISVAHNMVLASLKRYLNRFYLSTGKERDAVTGMIEDLSVRVADPNNSIDSLSGGNQQKVVVAKGLLTEPRVLLLDEPTRGIDINGRREIYRIMEELLRQGVGILMLTSDYTEALEMSHRVVVLRRGNVCCEFKRGEAEESDILREAIGKVNGN